MQPYSNKNNYNGSQNTVNNITAQNKANQTSVGPNNRQNISSLTPRSRYVPANTIFPTVHPSIVMSPLGATYANRSPNIQQCQYAPQYYPHVYYPYYMQQLPPQQQQQQQLPQNGAGNPLAGFNTIMAVQPGGFMSGPVTAANRTAMPFTVNTGTPVLNVANINSVAAVGMSALTQTLPFGLPSVTASSVLGAANTTTVSSSMAVTSVQQNQSCLTFATTSAAGNTLRITQPQVTAPKQQNSIQNKAKLRPHALQIIHPITNKDILQNFNTETKNASNIATEFGETKTLISFTHQLPTVAKSVEIMQNIETFSVKKKYKDATQQAEQKSIASAMRQNTSVEISAIPHNNLSTSKSELLITKRYMPVQNTIQRVVSGEIEEKDNNSYPITPIGNEKSSEKEIVNPLTTECENLLITPTTIEYAENVTVTSDPKENSLAFEDNLLTHYSGISKEQKLLEQIPEIKDNERENYITNITDLNLNEANIIDDIDTEDDGEVLSPTNLENDYNETMDPQIDEASAQITFFNETFTTFSDCGEIQEAPPLSPTTTLIAINSQNDETSAQITFFNEIFTNFSDCGEIQDAPFSPTNRIQYTRKQLMHLRQSKNSCMQPDLKNTCIFAPISLMPAFATRGHKKISSTASNQRGNNTPLNAQHNINQNSTNIRNMSTVGPPPANGHNNRMSSKPIIYLNLSLHQDVKLNKADNAWCPRVLLKAPDNLHNNPQLKEQEEKDELLRRVRGILNKLTPEKFEPLVKEIIKLKIDTLEKMEAVMNSVFEKAIDEPNFSVSYAKLCHRLINEVKARDERMESSTKSNLAHFRNALINKTESEFTNNVIKINAKEEKLKPIREKLSKCQDENEKIELEALLIEEERKIRRRSGGTVCFIGELFKISILSGKIINSCIEALLKESSNEDMLECLCKLLTTVGQKFEQTPTCQDDKRKYSLKSVIQRMQNIASKTGNAKISSRIRFMLLDVIDLRKKKWQSSRNEAPKTMEQIEKEANNTVTGSNNNSTIKRDDQKRLQGGLQSGLSNQSTYTATPLNSVSDANKKNTKQNSHSTEKRSERGRGSNLADNTYTQRNSIGGKNTNDCKWQVQTNKANSSQAVDTSKLVGLTTVDLNNKKMGDASLFQWKKIYTPSPATSQQMSNSFAPLSLEAHKSAKSEQEQDKSRPNARQKVPFNKVRNEHERFSHGPNRRHSQNTAKESQRKTATLHSQQTIRIQKSDNHEKYQQEITNSNLTRTPAKMSLLHKVNTAMSGEVEHHCTVRQPEVFIDDIEKHCNLMKSVIREMLENVSDSKCVDSSTVSCITKLPENLRCTLIYYILTDYLHLGNVKSLTRRHLSNIVSYLIERQFITIEHFHTAYTKFTELACELIVDIPQLWLYIFEFTGPLMVKHLLTINDLWSQQLKDSAPKDFGKKFLKSFIQYSTREVGPNFLRLTWKKLHMKWSNYMDEIMVQDFIKSNCFEYVEDENYSIPYNSDMESQDKCFQRISGTIQQMLSEGTTPDQIIDFIHGNIEVINQTFIKILTNTLTNFAIKNLGDYSLDVQCFQRICIPVLRRYLDSKDDLIMECLCAIQMLVHDLDHPKGLLQTIFFELSDADIIAQENFLSLKGRKNQCKKCSIANL